MINTLTLGTCGGEKPRALASAARTSPNYSRATGLRSSSCPARALPRETRRRNAARLERAQNNVRARSRRGNGVSWSELTLSLLYPRSTSFSSKSAGRLGSQPYPPVSFAVHNMHMHMCTCWAPRQRTWRGAIARRLRESCWLHTLLAHSMPTGDGTLQG